MPEDYHDGRKRNYTRPNIEPKLVKVNVKSVEIGAMAQERREKGIEEEPDFETQITEFNMEIAKFLIFKNTKYGNSALEPLRTFSKLNSEEQLLIRMDDKLSRIKNTKEPSKNDVIDLIGYLHLYALKKGWTDLTELID